MNVVLLYGGKSGEHEISLVSAASVARHLSKDYSVKLVSVAKDGKWYLEDDDVLRTLNSDANAKLEVHSSEENRVFVVPGGGKNGAFIANKNVIPCDVALPVMHGTYSEDGTLQGLLEMAGVPYVGCSVLASAVSMDKEIAKILWKNEGLPVVPYICLTRSDVNNSRVYDEKIAKTIEKFGFPLFVKPCSAGSSDGALKANNAKELSFALMEAFEWDNKVLIEKSIDAREVECSVIGNSITASSEKDETLLKAFGPGEIVPKHTFYDYDAKYNDPDGAELKIPADLSSERIALIKDMAKMAYRTVNASGLSRVDFFIDRKTDELYLNEINTMPGFTSISMFPKLCESEGLGFSQLVDVLLKEAVAAFEAKEVLRTSR